MSGPVTGVEETMNAYRILIGKPLGNSEDREEDGRISVTWKTWVINVSTTHHSVLWDQHSSFNIVL
jgi:hypothetical protein